MKMIVVVEPVYLRKVEDDQVDVVFPQATPEEVQVMEKKVRALLDDPREDEDIVLTLFTQGAPLVVAVKAERVRNVISE